MFKLVIEGKDGHEPLPRPVEKYFTSEEEALEAEKVAKDGGLVAFLVTPVTWSEPCQ